MRVETFVIRTDLVEDIVIPETEDERLFMMRYNPSIMVPGGYPFGLGLGQNIVDSYNEEVRRGFRISLRSNVKGLEGSADEVAKNEVLENGSS